MQGWLPKGALIAAAAVLFALLLAQELSDVDQPLTLWSMLAEVASLALLVGCTAACAALMLRAQAQEEETQSLRADLEIVGAQRERWREELALHLRAVGDGIRRQFEAWRLTRAEQDVAMLLLKGLSHKEIARLRRTSEATVRQQAMALYQKAGLVGRADLSAFFLDDLLAQIHEQDVARPSAAATETLSLGRRRAVGTR